MSGKKDYRILSQGEAIAPSDQWLQPGVAWRPASCSGQRFVGRGDVYRRDDAGYRYLDVGEKIEPRDRFLRIDDECNAWVFWGSVWPETGDCFVAPKHKGRFRRHKDDEPKAGSGCRFLGINETVLPGDQYLDSNGEWVSAEGRMLKTVTIGFERRFRRAVPAVPATNNAPRGGGVWRVLADGEVAVEETDEAWNGKSWVPIWDVSMVGTAYHSPCRRWVPDEPKASTLQRVLTEPWKAGKRRSGRTTRMLVEAYRVSGSGKKVVIMAANSQHATLLRAGLRELGDPVPLIDVQVEGHCRPEGRPRDCVVLYDHYTIETVYGWVFQEARRWDR